MRLISTFIVAAIGLLGCAKTNNQPTNEVLDSLPVLASDTLEVIDTTKFEYGDYEKLESYLAKSEVKPGRLETIDFDCAIIIYPSERQIAEMTKEYGEDDFSTVADDNQFYQAQAIELIDSVGIKKQTVSRQFLRLIGKDKTWDLDIRKKDLKPWNIIFFKRTKEPMIVSSIDLTIDQVKSYFN